MSAPTEAAYTFPQTTMSRSDAIAKGRTLRAKLPRRALARFVAADRDPIAILEEQNLDRLPDLVPIRMGRMAQSPFAYYRGSAAVMAADLAAEPRTEVDLVICGDAHLANFGLFASPERRIVFDLNDFDEAAFGPWEWDVKRLVASVIVAGRFVGLGPAQCTTAAMATAQSYRVGLERLFAMSALERFYFSVETRWLESQLSTASRQVLRKTVKKARRRTSDRVLASITTTDEEGHRRIVDQEPIVKHDESIDLTKATSVIEAYRRTVRTDIALLLEQFRLVDAARRIVGVGSVGTRCDIALLSGPADEPLFLQMKEAPTSVVESYGNHRSPPSAAGRNGWRVVAAQRVLQAVSDPFLGWVTFDDRDYYCRQFRDMKGTVELESLSPELFANYSALSGAVLARGHAQSRDAIMVSAYLGKNTTFDEAVTSWAHHYADQVERDYQNLKDAVRRGRIAAEDGV